jgi:[ribosomal protein S5]-alanine N-acetyltransferase
MIFLKHKDFTLQILDSDERQLELLNNLASADAFSGSQLGRLPLATLKKNDINNLILAITVDIGGNDTIIGRISLEDISYINQSAELKIIIRPDRHKKGIGYESCKLLVEHAFNQLNLHRIYAGTLENNIGFQKLAEKLGMEKEGTRKQAVWKNGKFVDVIEYGLLRK